MSVTFEIDELVLDGFPAEARYALAAGMERELTALLAAGSLDRLREGWELDALPPLRITMVAGATAEEAGRLAGRALYRALERSR